MKDVVRLSRYLCRVLRHHPEEIELKIDDRGWADTTELIEKVNTKKKIDIFTTINNIYMKISMLHYSNMGYFFS